MHPLHDMPTHRLRVDDLRKQLRAYLQIALAGLGRQTLGIAKFAEAKATMKSLDDVRVTSPLGACHKEELATLSVDIRGSSVLATNRSAEDMFVLVQCFLPLMTYITARIGGEVVGLRGDGLLSAFGFSERNWRVALNDAYEAGMLMIQSVSDVLNPFLKSNGFDIPISIGIGIDAGNVIITKIGLGSTTEVTAYGVAVNTAAKNSRGVNTVWISGRARDICLRLSGSKPATYRRSTDRLIKSLAT